MDAHYALKIVIDHINEIKGLSPAGSEIMLDPWDIADRIPYSYLSLTLEKMEKDHLPGF